VDDLHPEHVGEVPEAPVERRRKEFDAAEVRDVVERLGRR
jgi:hypothetical protein